MSQFPGSPALALVGCGHWGANLARCFHQLGALRAVVETDPGRARDVTDKFGVPILDWPDVLRTPDICAVAIAAPAEKHHELALAALNAGKDVYCEKPLALHEADARELCAAAERSGKILMVGHLLRHHPAFIALAEICASGRLGKLRYIQSHRLNLGKVRTEENILWSFAPHDISMILALAGDEPETVSAVGHNFLNNSVADVTTTHLSFASGLAAHIHVSWLHPFKEQKLVVVGDNGMAVFDDGRGWSDKLTLYSHRIDWMHGKPVPHRAEPEPVPLPQSEPLKLECAHFLDSVRSRRAPTTDGAEGLRVLKVLQAAQSSLETGLPVKAAKAPISSGKTTMIHPTAVVDQPSEIGEGSRIWHFAHVLPHSRIGADCTLGQNVVVGPHAVIGDRCKIQNNVSVYQGVTLEDGVFCGPSMVFTNVINPRAEIERKAEFKPTLVKRGASIGAGAVIVCGTRIGRWAMIGAAAVVVRDVPDHALMVGNPARQIGHVCRCGVRLPEFADNRAQCPACGLDYARNDGGVAALDETP